MAAFPDVFNKILECYALGLGYPEDFFRKACRSHHACLLLLGDCMCNPRVVALCVCQALYHCHVRWH